MYICMCMLRGYKNMAEIYDGDTVDIEGDWETKQSEGSKGKSTKPSAKGKTESMCCAHGLTSHKRSTHKECHFNMCKRQCNEK